MSDKRPRKRQRRAPGYGIDPKHGAAFNRQPNIDAMVSEMNKSKKDQMLRDIASGKKRVSGWDYDSRYRSREERGLEEPEFKRARGATEGGMGGTPPTITSTDIKGNESLPLQGVGGKLVNLAKWNWGLGAAAAVPIAMAAAPGPTMAALNAARAAGTTAAFRAGNVGVKVPQAIRSAAARFNPANVIRSGIQRVRGRTPQLEYPGFDAIMGRTSEGIPYEPPPFTPMYKPPTYQPYVPNPGVQNVGRYVAPQYVPKPPPLPPPQLPYTQYFYR